MRFYNLKQTGCQTADVDAALAFTNRCNLFHGASLHRFLTSSACLCVDSKKNLYLMRNTQLYVIYHAVSAKSDIIFIG